MKKLLLLLLLTVVGASLSRAADLMDVYHQALENDPIFKQAYSIYMASTEAIPQARAALYPQLTINAQVSRNVQDTILDRMQVENSYNSNYWQVNASQAVFNYQAWANVQQAKASVKAAQATFNSAAQGLIIRTAQAYFTVLFAQDTLNFAEAKKRANKRQLDQALERFKVGLDAVTSVYEAQSGYDQSIAEVIAAKNNQINQNENLRKLTNHIYENLAALRNSRIPLIKPEPNNIDEWVDTALRQNYTLYAAKFSLQAARENIKVQAAGSWPTFAIKGVGNQTHNTVDISSIIAPVSRQGNANLILAMNFPIIQGGLVQSQTRQAQYNFQSSSEQLENIYRGIMVDSRIAFNTIIDGISKVKADRQTVISSQNTVNSTDAQFQVGTRTMVDVVNAQQRLFEAQQQLAGDQYDLINATLNLKFLAGTLNADDIEEINSWLATLRIGGFPPPLSQYRHQAAATKHRRHAVTANSKLSSQKKGKSRSASS